MSWRLAKSLITLHTQVDARWPNRNKASDGTIGDSAHAAVKSEHNPNNAGVVTAIDITHDPASGADMQVLANELVASGDTRIWYIIFNRRIWEDGSWTPYSGTSDPHTNHLHLSTNQNQYSYDDPSPWNINNQGGNVSRDAITEEENDLLGWLATGVPGNSHPVFKNNVGNPLLTAERNYQGYSETRNFHLDVEDYRSGRLQNRVKQLEKSEQDLAQAVVDRDKRIVALEAQSGSGEFNAIGQALVAMISKFGYKKG